MLHISINEQGNPQCIEKIWPDLGLREVCTLNYLEELAEGLADRVTASSSVKQGYSFYLTEDHEEQRKTKHEIAWLGN